MLSYPYDKKNIEEFQNDPLKQYSSPSHASTCMLEGVVFPLDAHMQQYQQIVEDASVYNYKWNQIVEDFFQIFIQNR